MEKLKIKVCGLNRPDNIKLVANLYPDFMGFIFWPQSKRYAGSLSSETLTAIDSSIIKVGVFVNEEMQNVIDTASKYKISTIQLHGEESPGYCQSLRSKGFTIWKAFGIASENDLRKLHSYSNSVDTFLFDYKTAEHGGSGKGFDHNLLSHYSLSSPFILSGGIAPDDAELISQYSFPLLAGIDLNSRFEIAPGLKNISLLNQFISKIRSL